MVSHKRQVLPALFLCACVVLGRSLFVSVLSNIPSPWRTVYPDPTPIRGAAMILLKKPWWKDRGEGRKCNFNRSMDALQQYWHPTNPYPIVLTHPDDWSDEERDDIRARWPDLTIHFSQTNLSAMRKPPPDELLEDRDNPLSATSYKVMCAYKSYGFLHDPYLNTNGVEYVMHIDDDSCLTESIGYDVFSAMRHHRAVYAYKQLFRELTFVTRGMAEFAHSYMQRYHNGTYANPTLKQYLDDHTFTDRDPRGGGTADAPAVEQWAFSTNLEWIDLGSYRQPPIRDFLAAIESSQMIYHRRWGDAPIRFLLAYMFWNQHQILKVCSAGYFHSNWPPSPGSCPNKSSKAKYYDKNEPLFEIEDCIVHTIQAAKLFPYAN